MSSIQEVLDVMYERRKDMVFCLLGDPGIGKTQAIKQFADSKGVQLHEIYANTAERCEAGGGATMLDMDNRLLVRLDDEVLMRMKDGDILLYDEILTAPQPILSAMLKVLMDRKTASGQSLPDVMIIAAANYLPSASMLPLPIRQRFFFWDMEFDEKAWKQYMKDEFGLDVQDSLVRKIRTKGDGYNVLTPRSLTKLLCWVKDNKDKEDIISSIITDMYSSDLSYEILSCVGNMGPYEKIKQICRDYGVSICDDVEPAALLEFLEKNTSEVVYKCIMDQLAVSTMETGKEAVL